jgi:hypothetical protein
MANEGLTMNAEERFRVEVGRQRTIEEVRQALAEAEPVAARYKASEEAIDAMPGGPGRDAAAKAHGEEFDPDDSEDVCNGLREILPELEEIELVRARCSGWPEPKKTKCLEAVQEFWQTTVERHIRNCRHWIEVFGTESFVRIQVFSWVAGVEPNFDPLYDATPEESETFKEQAREMMRPVLEQICDKD